MPKMPLTNNSLSSAQSSTVGSGAISRERESLFDGNLLWIGDNEHFQMHAAWRVCRTHCDSISFRDCLDDAVESPPKREPTHVIVAQSNRHDRKNRAIDAPVLSQLRTIYRRASLLILRSPLVAPTVRLPPLNSALNPNHNDIDWAESISSQTAIDFLPHWLITNQQHDSDPASRSLPTFSRSLQPVVIVASRYSVAEPLIDSLSVLCTANGGGSVLIQWQRELTARSACGFATVLWDESAAPPTTAENWRVRRAQADSARHVWMTAMSNWQQRQLASENGIDTVLEKPGRLESLLATLAS